jgi:parallel beta-helix repeat protein
MLAFRDKKKISVLLFILLMGLTILVLNHIYYPKYYKEKIDVLNKRKINLKDAGSWSISPLTISGNGGWAFLASTYPWCSGNGTWSNPYVIENVTIVEQDTSDYCMEIRNSNVYFEVKTCRFYADSLPLLIGAVHLENVNNGFFLYNNFSLNWRGLHLENSNNITITGNIFTGYSNAQDCIRLELSENNTIIENLIQKTHTGIYLYRSHRNTISNNKITNTRGSIWNHESNHNNVSGNLIEYNDGIGIFLYYSNFTDTSNNIVQNNEGGSSIALDHCLNIKVLKNIIRNNLYIGIFQIRSNNSIIQANNITHHNNWGIYYDSNNNNTIKENFISYNEYGISTWYCNNNSVYGNNIIQNEERGLSILGDNNTILLNNFSYNGENVGSSGFNNKWDNGSIGNYYSDYSGKDANDDGIGDTIYIIGDTFDNFPIWWDPPVITIHHPISDQSFGIVPPSFNISIDEGFADTIWYSLNYSTSMFIIELNGTIDQGLWNSSDYDFITITFYANDSLGVIGISEVLVRKIDPAQSLTVSGYNLFWVTSLFLITLIIFFKRYKKGYSS